MPNLPPAAPDYFALFQSMFTPPGSASAAHAPPMFAMLDPKELERKIGELETVHAWLNATAGMIEMSLQTMKYQQSLLSSFADNNARQAPAAQAPNMEALAKMAGVMNPAWWAFNMMQPSEAPKAEKKPSTSTPRATTKKSKR